MCGASSSCPWPSQRDLGDGRRFEDDSSVEQQTALWRFDGVAPALSEAKTRHFPRLNPCARSKTFGAIIKMFPLNIRRLLYDNIKTTGAQERVSEKSVEGRRLRDDTWPFVNPPALEGIQND